MARYLPAAIQSTRFAAALLALLLLCGSASAADQTHDAASTAACPPTMQRADPRCVELAKHAADAAAPLMAPSVWFTPLHARGPAAPAAGSLLATICLAWLVLLAFATVIRPRGWHHRPLFGRMRRGDAGESA